uniref:NECAP endocytosis associated 2 n=1 Tax=Anser cygnoides TaxID=8845 RepID=A0A8B9ETX4_ANSCY
GAGLSPGGGPGTSRRDGGGGGRLRGGAVREAGRARLPPAPAGLQPRLQVRRGPGSLPAPRCRGRAAGAAPAAASCLLRAAEWQLERPAWSGRLRVTARGTTAFIRLEDKASGEGRWGRHRAGGGRGAPPWSPRSRARRAAGGCGRRRWGPGVSRLRPPLCSERPPPASPALPPPKSFVSYLSPRPLLSSRRAFRPGARGAVPRHRRGERDGLQQIFRHPHRGRERWVKQQSELAKQAENPDQGPKLDLGFKEGQTIKLNIASMKKKEGATGNTRPRPAGPGGLSLLPPPPGGKSSSPAFPSGEQPSSSLSAPVRLPGTPITDSLLSWPQPAAAPAAPATDVWGDFAKASGSAPNQTQANAGWVQF